MIPWDESIERIDVLSQCDGDFGVFDFDVSELQKKLVQFYSDCARWEATIRVREANQPKSVGPFYIVLNWLDEGYSGTRPVYGRDGISPNNCCKRRTRSSLTITGPYQRREQPFRFPWWTPRRAPSRLVWDARIKELADLPKSGNPDEDAEIYSVCVGWEAMIRKQRNASTDESPRIAGLDTVREPSDSRIGDSNSPDDIFESSTEIISLVAWILANPLPPPAPGQSERQRSGEGPGRQSWRRNGLKSLRMPAIPRYIIASCFWTTRDRASARPSARMDQTIDDETRTRGHDPFG